MKNIAFDLSQTGIDPNPIPTLQRITRWIQFGCTKEDFKENITSYVFDAIIFFDTIEVWRDLKGIFFRIFNS